MHLLNSTPVWSYSSEDSDAGCKNPSYENNKTFEFLNLNCKLGNPYMQTGLVGVEVEREDFDGTMPYLDHVFLTLTKKDITGDNGLIFETLNGQSPYNIKENDYNKVIGDEKFCDYDKMDEITKCEEKRMNPASDVECSCTVMLCIMIVNLNLMIGRIFIRKKGTKST